MNGGGLAGILAVALAAGGCGQETASVSPAKSADANQPPTMEDTIGKGSQEERHEADHQRLRAAAGFKDRAAETPQVRIYRSNWKPPEEVSIVAFRADGRWWEEMVTKPAGGELHYVTIQLADEGALLDALVASQPPRRERDQVIDTCTDGNVASYEVIGPHGPWTGSHRCDLGEGQIGEVITLLGRGVD